MILFPAIDLYGKKAVRLLKGDYSNMTVYSTDPLSVAQKMGESGAAHIHMVDLEGAKDGTTPNLGIVEEIKKKTGLFVEIGGGIRSEETIEKYLAIGVDRVILGTAAISDKELLTRSVLKYGGCIAVSADAKNGRIAVKGWLEESAVFLDDFLSELQELGVETVICTDISKDGAMKGTNLGLYADLAKRYTLNITASGGVSSLEDIRALRGYGLYGAILGKAYYTGAVDLKEALEAAK